MKVFAKITELLSEINKRIAAFGVKFGVREEYAIEYLEQILKQYIQLCGFDPASAVRGRGHHKTPEQRYYDKLTSYIARLRSLILSAVIGTKVCRKNIIAPCPWNGCGLEVVIDQRLFSYVRFFARFFSLCFCLRGLFATF